MFHLKESSPQKWVWKWRVLFEKFLPKGDFKKYSSRESNFFSLWADSKLFVMLCWEQHLNFMFLPKDTSEEKCQWKYESNGLEDALDLAKFNGNVYLFPFYYKEHCTCLGCHCHCSPRALKNVTTKTHYIIRARSHIFPCYSLMVSSIRRVEGREGGRRLNAKKVKSQFNAAWHGKVLKQAHYWQRRVEFFHRLHY